MAKPLKVFSRQPPPLKREDVCVGLTIPNLHFLSILKIWFWKLSF